jgi:hypothetical protein
VQCAFGDNDVSVALCRFVGDPFPTAVCTKPKDNETYADWVIKDSDGCKDRESLLPVLISTACLVLVLSARALCIHMLVIGWVPAEISSGSSGFDHYAYDACDHMRHMQLSL